MSFIKYKLNNINLFLQIKLKTIFNKKITDQKEREAFLKWLKINDYLLDNFKKLEKCLDSYLFNRYKDCYSDLKMNIVKNLLEETVIKKCDEINYDEEGISEAYILLHFLDRYHRFQIIYLKLFEKGLFPIKENIRIMDIGTGPAPSLYALSDMIELYKKFEKEVLRKSVIKKIQMDYAEKSYKFRNFLHHMTELYFQKSYVPFHFGTYSDAIELDFTKKTKPVFRSFDFIIYSNFLTTSDIVKELKSNIKKGAFYLRNKGIMLVVGGNPKDIKYMQIYRSIDEHILEQNYNNKNFRGSCKKNINSEEMSYSNSDIFGNIIKEFYKKHFIELFGENWKSNYESLNRIYKEAKSGKTKWYLTLYKRKSRYIGRVK